jgi:hypothetical protein
MAFSLQVKLCSLGESHQRFNVDTVQDEASEIKRPASIARKRSSIQIEDTISVEKIPSDMLVKSIVNAETQ